MVGALALLAKYQCNPVIYYAGEKPYKPAYSAERRAWRNVVWRKCYNVFVDEDREELAKKMLEGEKFKTLRVRGD
jgi:hypothetical protein